MGALEQANVGPSAQPVMTGSTPQAAPPAEPNAAAAAPPPEAAAVPPAQPPVRQVDPGASAVPGKLPAGMKEEQAEPEEQKEYERVMQALSQVIYGNDKVASAIVDQIQPNDKVGSTAKATMLLIQQLDEKVHMDESVVAEVTKEATDRLIELAEARHNIQYGERETQVILGSVWEGVQGMFGMEQQDAEALMAGIGGEDLANLKGQYEGFLNG